MTDRPLRPLIEHVFIDRDGEFPDSAALHWYEFDWKITDAGRDLVDEIPPVATTEQLHERVRTLVPDARWRIMQPLLDAYPDYFENLGEAQRYFDDFRAYYNNCHYHSGLNYYTPASVFNGTWDTIQKTRQAVLDGAYAARPDRFSRRPRVPAPPTEAWINQAARTITTTPEAAPTAS